MQLDCLIKQCFAMSGEYESCEASINLLTEQIVLVSKPAFGDPDDLENYMGSEHFEIFISYNNETHKFKVNKNCAENFFEITKDDTTRFKIFKSAILFHDKLNTDLNYKSSNESILKI